MFRRAEVYGLIGRNAAGTTTFFHVRTGASAIRPITSLGPWTRPRTSVAGMGNVVRRRVFKGAKVPSPS